MPDRLTRREWLKEVGAAGAGTVVAGGALSRASVSAHPAPSQTSRTSQPNGTIVSRTSASDVFVPPRGRGFQKFSFDFPRAIGRVRGLEFGFRVFTHENAYGLSSQHLMAKAVDGGLDVTCTELVWAGGQQRSPGRLTAHLTVRGNVIECDATAEMDRPVKAVAMILRGIPRGRLSAGGAASSIRATTRSCWAIRSPAAISSARRATAA